MTRSIGNLDEAAAWLEGLINVERRPDWPYARMSLAPIRALLARLGEPQRDLSLLHVGGSKGKGSTALLAEAVLSAAGERVGTFTSPHLERWSERFRLAGQEVEGPRLAAAVEQVRPHVEALRRSDPANAPTFFDATTAVALVLFREAQVDRAILEVGLGGRLDSTNAVAPRAICITSIELEHTDKLGETLAEIAGEKAGILKPGVPAVVGVLPEEARAVVAAQGARVGAPLAWAGEDFHWKLREEGPEGLAFDFSDGLDGGCELALRLPVLGRHQVANAALALAWLRRAGGLSDAALGEAARAGLARLTLPGRIERLRREPPVIVDGAHTAASAAALAGVLRRLALGPTHLVLSLSSGKQIDAILDELLPLAAEVTVTRAEPSRSLEPGAVAAAIARRAPELPLRVVPNPHLALRAAAAALGPGEALCVSGSVYLAGIARQVLGPEGSQAPVAVSRSPGRAGG